MLDEEIIGDEQEPACTGHTSTEMSVNLSNGARIIQHLLGIDNVMNVVAMLCDGDPSRVVAG
jgi:hypothetical protein